MNIAFFDFDGTITKKDSMFDFISFAVTKKTFLIGMIYLLPIMILTKLKIIPNYRGKEILLSHFFKGMRIKNFVQLASKYSLTMIDKIVCLDALERINWHKNNGDKVVVVSASINTWLIPWCDKNNIDLLATELEISNNTITGKLSSKNCHGVEKVNRIKERYQLENYKIIFAYGDTKGDKAMLELATRKYYRTFNNTL